MTDLITSVELEGGILIDFLDRSNRYFGDFHRVKIDAIVKLPVDVARLPRELQPLAEKCSGVVTYERSLEQMGVESGHIESVSMLLIDNFIETVAVYLGKEGFAESLLRKRFEEFK